MLVKKAMKIMRRDLYRIKENASYALLKIRHCNGMIIREIEGSKMYLDLRDKGISRELALNGIREERGTEIMRHILGPGQVVVDIGANIGYYALMEAKIVGPGGKVYAIEPVSANVKMLLKNIEMNGYSNIDVFTLAIGNADRVSQIYLSDRRNWHSMIRRGDSDHTEEVQMLRLDTFLNDKLPPDLVRMDVEGFETEIIKGMVNTLSSARKLKLFIEVHPHIMKKEDVVFLLDALKAQGFDIIVAADRRHLSHPRIEELLVDDDFLVGRKGGLLLFFEKKNAVG